MSNVTMVNGKTKIKVPSYQVDGLKKKGFTVEADKPSEGKSKSTKKAS